MHDETRVVRAGHPPASQGEAFMPGPVFAGPYHAAGDPAAAPYTYGRFHNPTWTRYEAALSELEGGPALAFASGMAATTAIFGTSLRPGDWSSCPPRLLHDARSRPGIFHRNGRRDAPGAHRRRPRPRARGGRQAGLARVSHQPRSRRLRHPGVLLRCPRGRGARRRRQHHRHAPRATPARARAPTSCWPPIPRR